VAQHFLAAIDSAPTSPAVSKFVLVLPVSPFRREHGYVLSGGRGSSRNIGFRHCQFSTAISKRALHVASAVIRPNSDQPTIGQVTYWSPKD